MIGTLKPFHMKPLSRGCVDQIVYRATTGDSEWIDKTNKRFFLTAKQKPWDDDPEDKTAVFKVQGQIPDETEPGRVVFPLSEENTYLNPKRTYFADIVETDSDGTSNARRVFIGYFEVIPGSNNKETGGN